ncbi:MAG TPA: aldolase/citrate lyase family protein [Ramlibacter sp.]|uniref:HpcH/HpaI aldolase family protein n=1 Tax=Ramlibacter sp. TaxID=1917967 RepID=UPI002B5BF295|nr:aldolase/citrate lyase family protein [Ramlibacter sp.]HVZ43535.1 aldolase/citrate lyase family protein [Ramlibacter sp.]
MNDLRKIWTTGGTTLAMHCAIASAHLSEVLSRQGFEAVLIDTQHAPIGYDAMFSMLQVIAPSPSAALVRVAWNDPALIQRALDAGAEGVMCPMVNTAAQCRAFVEACMYAPAGYRSFGPVRGASPAYFDHANDSVLPIAMIETEEAVRNIADIVRVPGLAAIYVGPSDMGITMGIHPSEAQTHPRILGVMGSLVQTCREHGVVAGIHGFDASYARARIAEGFQLLTTPFDVDLLAGAARDWRESLRG